MLQNVNRHRHLCLHEVYTRKNAQLVTNLQHTCSKSAHSGLLHQLVCWQDVPALVVPSLLTSCYKPVADSLYTSLMNSTALLQVVPTTCYRAASQQLVNKLWVTNLVQLDKNNSIATNLLTSLLQVCCEHNLLTSSAFLSVYVSSIVIHANHVANQQLLFCHSSLRCNMETPGLLKLLVHPM